MRLGSHYIVIIVFWVALFQGCKSAKQAEVYVQELQLNSFNQLSGLLEAEKRPIIVFFHAPWCHFCENMKQTTFKDPSIREVLNNDFYFISFDGEQKEEVLFQDKLYRYLPQGRNTGTHELALELGTVDGSLTYPTVIIMDDSNELIYKNNSFISGDDLKRILDTFLINL